MDHRLLSPPQSLGDKLQVLALIAPWYLKVIEGFVDLALSRLDR